jgi:hypothetical protein
MAENEGPAQVPEDPVASPKPSGSLLDWFTDRVLSHVLAAVVIDPQLRRISFQGVGTTERKFKATEILHSVATLNQTENTPGIKEFGIGRSFCGAHSRSPRHDL